MSAASQHADGAPAAVLAVTEIGHAKQREADAARQRADRYNSQYGGMLQPEDEPAPAPKGRATRADLQRSRDDAQRKYAAAYAAGKFDVAAVEEDAVKRWEAAIRLFDKSEQDARTAAQSTEAVAARRAAAEAEAKRVADAAANAIKVTALVEKISDLMVELDVHGLTALLGESGFPGRQGSCSMIGSRTRAA